MVPHDMTTTACFVIGTDTGVGKTRASVALLRGLQAAHPRCVGMKPVASGCDRVDGRWVNDDARQLQAASTVQLPAAYTNPYAFPAAIAPHLAAREAGERVDLDHIEACFHALCQQADAVVVEGAGGLLVPLNDEGHTLADLVQRLNIPVVLVVGMRLGCLNHALLTQEAVLTRRIMLAGWVANALSPDMAHLEANVDTLRQHLQAPLLAQWGWQPDDMPEPLTLPGHPAG